MIPFQYQPTAESVRGYMEDAVRQVDAIYSRDISRCDQAGLQIIDDVLKEWKQKGAPVEKIGKSLFAMGSYAGEVLLRLVPGQWFAPPSPRGEPRLQTYPFLAVRLQDGRVWHPINRAFQMMSEPGPVSLSASMNRLLALDPALAGAGAPLELLNPALGPYFSVIEAAGHVLRKAKEGDLHGGLAFQRAMDQSQLDGTAKSLERIDHLLDQIRQRFNPQPDAFLQDAANVNFLYVLAFYVGSTVAKLADAPQRWVSYDQMLARDPGIENVWPRVFESSVICTIERPGQKPKEFLPLVPILIRLFEGSDEKSVAFSAAAFY